MSESKARLARERTEALNAARLWFVIACNLAGKDAALAEYDRLMQEADAA